jgi:transposase InsO family protein
MSHTPSDDSVNSTPAPDGGRKPHPAESGRPSLPETAEPPPAKGPDAGERPAPAKARLTAEERGAIIGKVVNERMPQAFAAGQLGLTVRQVQRMASSFKRCGEPGLVHGLAGRPSNNSRLDKARGEAVNLIKNLYAGAGPTLGAEVLAARHGIDVSRETLRRWLMEDGAWEPGRPDAVIRRRRTRMGAAGELVQIDTSEHPWLALRPELVLQLICSKDDATGEIFCRFYETDSTMTNMDFPRRHFSRHGRPVAFHVDRASHFHFNPPRKGPRKPGPPPETQIGRALRELDIKLIKAGSPQAKGRIEREFGTLQDRLCKLMLWDKVGTLREANEYLEQGFLDKHNKRFMVKPKYSFNLNRPLTGFDLDAILSVQETRVVGKDHVVNFSTKKYQLLVDDNGPNLAGKTVTVEERLNGNLKFRYAGKYYNYGIKS